MSLNRKLVRLFVSFIDGWNKELHQALEERVLREYQRSFPDNNDSREEREKRIADMRAYYKAGITTTASLLVAAIALLVSVIALIVAVVQIFGC